MINLFRMKAIMVKELRQLSRDRLTYAMIVMLPLIQLLLFGFAINTVVRHVPVAVVDQSHTQASRWIIESVKASQVVEITHQYHSTEQAQQAIKSGEVRAALVLPHDLIQRQVQGRVLGQWMIDGSDSMISSTILGLQNLPVTPKEKLSNIDIHQKSQSQTFEMTMFYNPSQKTSLNIVPGLLGVILSMTMVLFTSIAIVRESEQGNLELLITTPVSSLELMIAKIVPYIFVGLLQVLIVLSLGHWIFDVPINGSILDILLGSLVFISASLTLGLLISTIAKTQLQAMQLTLFVILPSILLSGFMFPIEGMPVVAQWIAQILPATHYMSLIRALVLKGADLSDLYKDVIWLSCFTVGGVIVAALRFKKTLD
ncbi:ABC transporter permease [Vibrio gangliei]|uniref:ABC transporter permease n=1 Tax=Vibrio gangliei TaxID=2077090 RepID=UPI000D013E52|nr:ABC transporter permease [Vibrio gangliei]